MKSTTTKNYYSTPEKERERLDHLEGLGCLFTPKEGDFDEITLLASQIFQTPMAAFSLVTENKQWFKSSCGLRVDETERKVSFCQYVVHQHEALIVEDASEHEVFKDNPLVVDDPHIRFYVSQPLITSKGYCIGTLCVIDDRPKKAEQRKLEQLKILANQVVAQIELRQKLKELEQVNAVLFKQREEIVASTKNARRILNAVLPDSERLQEAFQDFFVVDMPKEELGGDFYYMHRKGQLTFFAVGDSTGHGTAGAFLSITGIELLNRIIKQGGVEKPWQILEELNQQLNSLLNREQSELMDGMEIGLCAINSKTNHIEFSGAGIHLLMVKDGSPFRHSARKLPIGLIDNLWDCQQFPQICFPFSGKEHFYMYSDGFPDQFSMANGRKYQKKRLIKFLSEMGDIPFESQAEFLKGEFSRWRGDSPQIDDVIIVGFIPKRGIPSVQKTLPLFPEKSSASKKNAKG